MNTARVATGPRPQASPEGRFAAVVDIKSMAWLRSVGRSPWSTSSRGSADASHDGCGHPWTARGPFAEHRPARARMIIAAMGSCQFTAVRTPGLHEVGI